MSARMARRLLVATLLGLLALASSAAPAPTALTPELKARLVAALAQGSDFADRYDAEVWLVDMSRRLRQRIPDVKRRVHLLRVVHSEAARARLKPELVLAVIDVESRFDRFAISEAGARGLMQIMPFWLNEIGHPNDSLFDVRTNLRMGCTILRYYLDREAGNLTRALARYNGSVGRYRYPNRVYRALRTRWYP